MIVADGAVLAYAVGADRPLRELCRALVSAVAAGSVPATTTVEVVQEFVHVHARRRGAPELARDDADLLVPLGRDARPGTALPGG